VVAATHSDGLKTFGLAEPRVLTGAMARASDGTPLYTMLPGAVGSSHALDAASREGLPEHVLSRASELLLDPLCAPGALNGASAEEDGGECALDPDGESSAEAKQRQMRVQSELLISALQDRMAEADEAAKEAQAVRDEAELAKAQAQERAAKAAQALAQAERFLQDRTRLLDGMVARKRAEGGDDLMLLGETLKALRLAEIDATQSRERALEALGLQPVKPGMRLSTGAFVSCLVEQPGKKGGLQAVDARVVDDAGPSDSAIKVSVNGAPGAYVPREELATWLVGGEDFSDMDAWGFGP
jgi:hypothetical protein